MHRAVKTALWQMWRKRSANFVAAADADRSRQHAITQSQNRVWERISSRLPCTSSWLWWEDSVQSSVPWPETNCKKKYPRTRTDNQWAVLTAETALKVKVARLCEAHVQNGLVRENRRQQGPIFGDRVTTPKSPLPVGDQSLGLIHCYLVLEPQECPCQMTPNSVQRL